MKIFEISVYLFLVAFLSAAGSILPLYRDPDRTQLRLGISFGAGVLLSSAFTQILPAIAAPLGDKVGFPILAGFLLLYILEKFVMIHPCEEGDCRFHKVGTAAFWGISFHSFLDGITLGASLVFPPLTLVVFLAIAVHKFPSAVSLSSILMYDGGFAKERILKLAVLFSLTTPLGALTSWLILEDVSRNLLSMVLGFSMGTFLSIAIADLLPQVHSGTWREKTQNMAAMFLGMFVIWAGEWAARP